MKKTCLLAICVICLAAQLSATSVSLKLSGPGAIDDKTIKAGEKVTVDIFLENEGNFKGFTLGFKIISDNIKQVVHPADSGNGINAKGDIKGFNGFHDKSIWDLGGVHVVERDWDGNLPEIIGFGGISKSKPYAPHKAEKKLSFDLVVDEAGTIVIDSSYFKPTGKWMFAPPNTYPKWNGPYKFTVKK